MTFFEEVKSLEERALSEIGVKILELIADRKHKHLDTRLKDIERALDRSADYQRLPAFALMNAGFLEPFGWDTSTGMNYKLKLTDKGWDFVGNKPIWL